MSSRDEFRDIEKLYAKAAKHEFERDYNRAFQLYIKAAESYIYLDRGSTDSSLRAACKAEAAKALERAEKLKAVKHDLTPVTKDYLSEGEQSLVLQRSSNVNGVYFPLWSETGANDISANLPQPALSDEQVSKGAIWRRHPHQQIYGAESTLSPEDIVQHIVSDCSVCASVAVCVNNNIKFRSTLGMSILYPQNGSGIPMISESGRYHLRLYFNGAHRRVDIDDKLPTYPDGTLMCMSTGVKNILWPSLVEKAYMRLMGGYEFPGSLSSIDLYTLIGWIPEYIDFASTTFQREKTWRRLFTGFQDGMCLMTAGTGVQPSVAEIGNMALIPAHCYAITGMTEDHYDRALTVLDVWTGATSQASREQELNLQGLSLRDTTRARSCQLPWDVVCSTFEGLYLSWNPAIFPYRVDFHGTWKRETATDKSYPLQFRLNLRVDHAATASKQRSLWLLLSRHVVDSHRKNEFISLCIENDDSTDVDDIHVKGEYTSTTHVLVKTEYSTDNPVLTVVASYDGEYDEVGFTIAAFSCSPLAWEALPDKLLFHEILAGAFTNKTSGGNPSLPTFMLNPQYHLRIYPEIPKKAAGRGAKATTRVSVKGDRSIPLSASLVWSKGQRITEMARNETVAASGPYKYGFASLAGQLAPGDYTLIVSTFDPRHTGTFVLEMDSSLRFDLTAIPQEGIGMFSKTITGSWAQDTAGGGPSSKHYTSNPLFKLDIPRSSQVIIRLQTVEFASRPSINVTVFSRSQKLGLGPHVTTSGPYSDAVCGVVTPQIMLQPGTYLIIPSTYNPGVEGKFKLIVYTSASGAAVAHTTLKSTR